MSSSSYKVNDVVWVRYGDYPWNCKKAEKYKKNKEVQSSVREAESFIRDGKKVEDEYKEAAGPSASSSDEDDDDSEEDSDDGDQNDVNKEQDHKQTEEDGDDKDDDDNNADGNEEEEIEDSSMAKTSEVPKKMNKKLVKGDKKINGKKESEQATESVAVATEQDEQEKRPFDNDVDNDEGHARKGRRLKSLAEVDAEDDDEEDDDVEDDDRHREEANEQDRDYDEEEDDNDGDDGVHIKPKKKKKKKREKNSIARDNHEGRKYDSHNDENKKKRRRQSTGPATNSSSSSSGEKSKRRKRNGKQKITSIVNAKDEKNEYSSTKRKRKMGLTSKTTTMPTALQKKRKKQKSGGEKKRAKERVTPGTEMQQQNISSKNHTNKIDIDDSPHSSPHRVGMEEFEEEIGGGGGISEMRNLQSKLKNKLELRKKKAKAAQVKKRKLREQRDELKERLQELSRELKQLTEENDYNEKMMSQREKSPSARLPQSPLQQEKQQPPSSKLVNSDPSNPIKKEKGEQTENSKDVDEGKMQVTNEEGHTDDIPAAGTSTANNGETGSPTSAVKARDAETSTPVDPKFKKGEMVLNKGVMARVEGVHHQSESYTLDCGNGRTPNVPFGSANIKSPHHSKNTSHSSTTTKIGDQDKKDEDEKIAVTAQNTNSPTENMVDEKEQNIENEDNEKEGKEPGRKMTMAVSSSSNSNIVNGGEDTSGKMETEENEKEKSNNAEDVKAKIENQSS